MTLAQPPIGSLGWGAGACARVCSRRRGGERVGGRLRGGQTTPRGGEQEIHEATRVAPQQQHPAPAVRAHPEHRAHAAAPRGRFVRRRLPREERRCHLRWRVRPHLHRHWRGLAPPRRPQLAGADDAPRALAESVGEQSERAGVHVPLPPAVPLLDRRRQRRVRAQPGRGPQRLPAQRVGALACDPPLERAALKGAPVALRPRAEEGGGSQDMSGPNVRRGAVASEGNMARAGGGGQSRVRGGRSAAAGAAGAPAPT